MITTEVNFADEQKQTKSEGFVVGDVGDGACSHMSGGGSQWL